MNRQINYIIYAFLMLVTIGSGLWFVQKLPVIKTESAISKQEAIFPKEHITFLTNSAAKGKVLFQSKCASCHALFKDVTGPRLFGFEDRGPWADRNNVYEWIRNPEAFMAKNEYAKSLKERFGTLMTAFPSLTNEEIDTICDYINETEQIQYNTSKVD